MDRDADAVKMLRWGLRKYAWVVVLFTLAVGVLLPVLQAQSEDVYEATALVHLEDELALPSLDALPRYGETIFRNGAVASQIRADLGLPETEEVVPTHAELIAEQDNVVFTVIGRDEDPEVAQDVANTAAAVFALEMSSSKGVGQFVVQHGAELPAEPAPSLAGGRLALVIAPIAGALAGVGLVAFLLILRQPVLGAASAEAATGAPVLGRVKLPRRRGSVDERDVLGLAALARRLLAGPAGVILLASPRKAARNRHRLLSVLGPVLERAGRVHVRHGGGLDTTLQDGLGQRRTRSRRQRRQQIVVVDAPTQEEQTVRPDDAMMLLVVPEGIGFAPLTRAAQEYLDDGATGVVLVSRGWRWRRAPRRERAADADSDTRDAPEDGSFIGSFGRTGNDEPDRSGEDEPKVADEEQPSRPSGSQALTR